MEARPQNGWFRKQNDERFEVFVRRRFLCSFLENEDGGSLHLFVFSTFDSRGCFRDFRDACYKQSSVEREEVSLFTLDHHEQSRAKNLGKKEG